MAPITSVDSMDAALKTRHFEAMSRVGGLNLRGVSDTPSPTPSLLRRLKSSSVRLKVR